MNKIGNGFSRILNLVNVNNKDKNEIDKGGKTLSSEETNSLREKKGKIDLKIFNETGYKKGKKNIFRNINIETNLKTMPSYDEVRSGFQTQRLNKMSIEEMKSKNSELNSNLPPITSRNDIMDIYEEGKEQKDAPKLIKIIKKKK